MKTFTPSVRKFITTFLLGVVMCFGMLFAAKPAHAQMTATEMQAEINRLTALIEQLLSIIPNTSTTGSTSDVCPYTWTRTLSVGDSGADVQRLQQYLNQSADTRVASYGVGSQGNEGRYYGTETASAVSKFQVKYRSEILSPLGLVNPNGVFGAASMAKLNALCAAPPVYDPDPDLVSNVAVEVSTTDAGVTSVSSAAAGEHGEFEIELDVTAVGDDVYIYRHESAKDGAIPVRVRDGAKGRINQGDLAYSITSSADIDGSFFEIKEGETETITIIADFAPYDTMTYRMEIPVLPYVVGQAGGVVSTIDLGDDVHTDAVLIQGSGDTSSVETLGITVTKPNGGEEWVIGKTNTITWTPYSYNPDQNPASDVTAYLEKRTSSGNFRTVGKIMASGKASIHTDFSIDEYGKYPKPGNYYVRVVNDETGKWDRSNRSFKLVAKDPIRITTPNGGEVWTIGETNTVTWSPYDYNPDVNASYDVDVYLEKKQSNGTFKTIGLLKDQGKASLHTNFEVDTYGNYAKPGTYYVRAVNRETGAWDRSDRAFRLVAKETAEPEPIPDPTPDPTPEPIPSTEVPQLHVVGVYQAKNAVHNFCKSEWGDVTVKISPTLDNGRPVVLGLSSYEPVNWKISNPSNVPIEKIILTGYNAQRVSGDKGDAKIVHKTYQKLGKYTQGGNNGQGAFYDATDGSLPTIYGWASMCADSASVKQANRRYLTSNSDYATGYVESKSQKLLTKMKQWSGASSVSSFNGAYNGKTFTVGGAVQGASTINEPVEAYIQVTAPNGGETLVTDEPVEIKWNSAGTSKMSLALYKDNKWLHWIEKDMSVEDAQKGFYTWIPSEDVLQKVGTDASVLKIYATARKDDMTGYVDDKSDTTFSMVGGLEVALIDLAFTLGDIVTLLEE